MGKKEPCSHCGELTDQVIDCRHICPECEDELRHCWVCPKQEACDETQETCKNPCPDCPMKDDCYTESTDKRHECQAFIGFLEKECGRKLMTCPCGYTGDDFTKRDANASDTVFSCGPVEIWVCPDCGKEIAETKEEDDPEEGCPNSHDCGHCNLEPCVVRGQ